LGKKKTFRITWLAIAGITLLIAGLTSERTGSVVAGASGETLVFGAAVSLTGATANEGRYVRDGYVTAADVINAAGGIKVGDKRYRVELKLYDDASRPEQTAKLVERLISHDRVNFVLGPYGSGPTEAAAAVVERHRVPMVEANGAAESIFDQGRRYTFGVLSPGENYLHGILDLVNSRDPTARRVAILAETDSFAIEVAEGAAAYAVDQGFTVVYNERYPAKATDVSAQLTAVRELRPDILLGAGHLQDTIALVRQAKQLGVNARAWGFSVGPSVPEFRRSLQRDADYIMGAAQWTEKLNLTGDDLFGTPQGFADALRARFTGYETTVPYHAAQSAAALIVYQKAIEAAGSLTQEKVRDQLGKLSFDSFYGRIQFDERGINLFKPMAVEQNQTDGGIYTIGPSIEAERSMQHPTPRWDARG
jgi:branched-chain amino acid transport system substrate-binding protein